MLCGYEGVWFVCVCEYMGCESVWRVGMSGYGVYMVFWGRVVCVVV